MKEIVMLKIVIVNIDSRKESGVYDKEGYLSIINIFDRKIVCGVFC